MAARDASPRKMLFSVITAGDRRSPGGEPLWRLCRRPATFILAQVPLKTHENGRLPGTSRRDAFTHDFRFICTRGHRTASRWVIPGSRPLRHFVARQTWRCEKREVIRLHTKAAPLQSLRTNAPRQRAKPFGDRANLRYCLETRYTFAELPS